MLWFFFFPHWKLVFLSFSANANFGSMSLPKVVWSSLEKGRGWDGLWSPAWGSHSWWCYRGLSILEWGKPCGHCFQAVTFPPTRPTHQKYPAAVDIQSLSRVSLWPHGLQHARLPSLSPRVYSNSCPLSWWYHPTMSSSVAPFYSCPQSFSASG